MNKRRGFTLLFCLFLGGGGASQPASIMKRISFCFVLLTTFLFTSCENYDSPSNVFVGTWETYNVYEVAPLPWSETLEETPFAVRSITFTETDAKAVYGTYNYKTKKWSNLRNEHYDRYDIPSDYDIVKHIRLWQGTRTDDSFTYGSEVKGELTYTNNGNKYDYSITQCQLRKK